MTLFDSEVKSFCTKDIYSKDAILWDLDGSEIADYLTYCELRRYVEPNEILGEIQGLLNREKLGADNDWEKEQQSLLTEMLEIVHDDSESKYDLQLSY